MKKRCSDKKRLIIILISIIIFAYIFKLVFNSNENILDKLFVTTNKDVVSIFKVITRFGDWYTLIFITLLTLGLKNKNYFKYITINLASATLVNQILKIILKRPRPHISHIDASGYSFPSGHAMVSMAFYGLIIYFILKSNLNKKLKILSIIGLCILIFLIGISRTYLGVHYLTDIIAGFALAILYLSIYTLVIKLKGVGNEK